MSVRSFLNAYKVAGSDFGPPQAGPAGPSPRDGASTKWQDCHFAQRRCPEGEAQGRAE